MIRLTDKELDWLTEQAKQAPEPSLMRKFLGHIEAITEELRRVSQKSEERRTAILTIWGDALTSGLINMGDTMDTIAYRALSDNVPGVVEHTEHRWVVEVSNEALQGWRQYSSLPAEIMITDVFCAVPGCGITPCQEVK